jgi:hypothetical protein
MKGILIMFFKDVGESVFATNQTNAIKKKKKNKK